MAAARRAPTVVVAPDSFKGSLDAPAVCAAIARGLTRVWPDAHPRSCPMADGGEGMLAALGLRLIDKNGNEVAPTPRGLMSLSFVDAGALDPRLAECTIAILSDVDNPLCGPRGATATFGPQKGVRSEEIVAFDAT